MAKDRIEKAVKTAAQLINQTSGKTDYHTPGDIVEALHRFFPEGVDLDPASSAIANKRIQAGRFFTAKQDGLKQAWHAYRMFMNHPFGRQTTPLWINKLEAEFAAGHVKEAVVLTYAATSERWFQPLARRAQCYLHPRTNYLLPNGKVMRGVSKGSVLTYLGPLDREDEFARCFHHLGVCKRPFGPVQLNEDGEKPADDQA